MRLTVARTMGDLFKSVVRFILRYFVMFIGIWLAHSVICNIFIDSIIKNQPQYTQGFISYILIIMSLIIFISGLGLSKLRHHTSLSPFVALTFVLIILDYTYLNSIHLDMYLGIDPKLSSIILAATLHVAIIFIIASLLNAEWLKFIYKHRSAEQRDIMIKKKNEEIIRKHKVLKQWETL